MRYLNDDPSVVEISQVEVEELRVITCREYRRIKKIVSD